MYSYGIPVLYRNLLESGIYKPELVTDDDVTSAALTEAKTRRATPSNAK